MGNETVTIPLLDVNPGITCESPNPEDTKITENDPAISVMTDFTRIMPVTVEANVNLHTALGIMKAHGIRLLLVTGNQGEVVGVLTAYDIQSEKPIQYGSENDIPVSKIQTGMIMTPLGQTPAFDFNAVEKALVRHVIDTMKELERPHTLVIQSNGDQRIRGVFSTSQISKQLGRPVYQPLHAAHSFADIQHEISNH